jgi:hypothetical protein
LTKEKTILTASTRPHQRQQALIRQVARLDRRLESLTRRSSRYAWARLLVFLIAVSAAIGIDIAVGTAPGLIAGGIGLVAFGAAARLHRRIKDTISRFTLWRAIKQMHLARLALDWDHLPPSPALPPDPLALDLDLTGEQSLHRLIDSAAAHDASRRLFDWLTAGVPDPAAVQRRQTLVRELAPLTLFRDKLWLAAALPTQKLGTRWHGDRLRGWLALLPPEKSLRPLALLLTGLAALNALLFALTQIAALPPAWVLTWMIYAAVYLWQVQRLGDPFTQALAIRDPLDALSDVLHHLETDRYAARPALRALCDPFLAADRRPSAELRRLGRVLAAASVRGNPLLWSMISAVLPWDVYVAHWLNRRRQAVADLLPRWLDVWHELEALCSLANFAYLTPAATFPTLGADVLDGRDLGHPLIPAAERVCNDFALRRLGDVALLTGSNMSGKSTFLRTLGLTLCLAYAGGPVLALDLRTGWFRLFSCVRVTDSVTNGISYFYAEVKRLKALLDALEADHPFPLFFLIDEIFRGTNNRERLIGSRAYVRALAGKHGVGVISTHDLELVRLADDLPAITNYHFAETVGDGRLVFDYRLRSGPCPTTNALAIMHMEGLPVEVEEINRVKIERG